MIPQAAVIILIAVAGVAAITFLIAIYHTISSRIRTRKLREAARSNGSTLPLTEATAAKSIMPTSSTTALVTIERSPTPEAEFPPPLPDDLAGLVEAESPPPLRKERDSMHEIIDLYTNEARNLPPVPKSAPARITTFAQADSKWAYIGAKRAEIHVV